MAADHDGDLAYQLYEQGKVLMQQDDMHQAILAFEASAIIEPHFKTLELLGECLLDVGRARDAILPLAAATSLGKTARAPALLAKALLETGKESDAMSAARVALERDPAIALAKNVLARKGA